MSAVESLVRRERAVVGGAIVALAALAWFYIWQGAGMGMSARDMTTIALFPHLPAGTGMTGVAGTTDMAGMARMPAMAATAAMPVHAVRWTTVVLMWWTMMIAMMMPSAAPLLLLYGRVLRQKVAQPQAHPQLQPQPQPQLQPQLQPQQQPQPQYAAPIVLAAGYLAAWLAFSIAASSIQIALQRMGVMSATVLRSQSAALSAAVLLAAGIYQLSPLKSACLRRCRGPVEFLVRHWRPGWGGAFRMGMRHGAVCVGCCWMLMALLFVGGVMNLVWVALLALLVLVEKVAPAGVLAGRVAGIALLGWGAATVFA